MELCCNQLEGPIPTELGNLTQLTVLSLNGNHLNGSVPESLGNLSSLTRLDISYDLLSGSIPVSFAKLTNLSFLDVRNNSLSGPIPTGEYNLLPLNSQFRTKKLKALPHLRLYSSPWSTNNRMLATVQTASVQLHGS